MWILPFCLSIMKIKHNKAIYIVVVLVLIVFLFGNEGFRKMIKRYTDVKKFSHEISRLKKEKALLKKEIYFLEQNTSYIEYMARKELGLISDGEIEYRFNK